MMSSGGTPDDTDWKTQGFRQSMVAKIDEAVMRCGAPTTKTPMEMESQVFSKAKSKDEYLGFVARLIIHIKEMGSKKMGGGPGMPNQQNPSQGMGQMGVQQQNMGMMSQMNHMGQMNMMNQPGMVQMNPGMAAALAQQQQQQQQQNQQMGNQGNAQNPMMNQQSFMQQQQMQQMQNSQLQPGQMQNPQMGSVQMQNQQMAQLQNQQLQNAQLQNSQMQNQQLHSQQLQNAQMQNQQLQNMQMQNAQLQDHIRGSQMGGVQINSVQLQGGQLGNVQITGSQMGNVTMGTPGQMNPQMGNPQMGNPQMQGGQPIQHAQLGNPNLHGMMNAQQQPQQMMGRGMPVRMMGPGQANMANQLSALAKQQQQTQRGLHRPPVVDGVNVVNQYNTPQQAMMGRGVAPPQFMPPQPGQGPMVQTPSPGPPSGQTPYVNSPAPSTLMPSPAAPGMSQNLRPYQNSLGVPSPGTSLNTPLMVQPTPSPRNADDQACMEKIKELRRYTDLLQRMIAKIGNDENREAIEKSSKMKKLLEILTNPNQRVSMDILLKCEVALKKMEKQQNDPGSVLGPTPQPPQIKDQSSVSPFLQFMESLSGALRNPSSSHTLLRTFRPTVEALAGHSFASVFHDYEEEDGSSDTESIDSIPSTLKRELRTLDSRFHVTVVKRGGGMSRLSCNLNDPRLPCVPPLKINVRSDYPFEPPIVVDLSKDYGSTSFLSSVERALKSRMLHLTRNHAVIELLYMWEMCVRQASNPNLKSDSTLSVPRAAVALGL